MLNDVMVRLGGARKKEAGRRPRRCGFVANGSGGAPAFGNAAVNDLGRPFWVVFFQPAVPSAAPHPVEGSGTAGERLRRPGTDSPGGLVRLKENPNAYGTA